MEPTAGRPPLGVGEPAAGRPQRVSRAGQRRRPSGEAPPLPRALNRSGRLWLTAAGAVLLLWAAIVTNQRTLRPGPRHRPPCGRVVRRDAHRPAHRRHADGARARLALDDPGPVLVDGGGAGRPAPVPAPVRVPRRHPDRDRPHRPVRLPVRLSPAPGRGDPRRLERLRPPVAFGGRPDRGPDGHALLPGPRGTAAPPGQAGHRRPGHGPVARPHLPGREHAQRRAHRRRHRGHHPAGGLPDDHPQRGVPGHLPPRQLGPPGHRRPPRRGHPPGPRGPARGAGGRDQAVRPLGVGRLHPHAGQGQGRARDAGCSPSCTPAATSARTGGTSWAGPCCTGGWRTRSRSTPSGGWSSRRTTPCG